MRTGAPLPPPDGHDAENAVVYERFRDRSLTEIRDYARSSWELLATAVTSASDIDLERPNPHNANEQLWLTAFGTAYHTGEHLSYLYAQAGDETGAEDAQKWMHDLYVDVAPDDDRQRGGADYNFACFYAARGRADEALPLLRNAFALRPDLAEWARQDSDLDPIRDDPRLVELLDERSTMEERK